jgi:hypothetical protein
MWNSYHMLSHTPNMSVFTKYIYIYIYIYTNNISGDLMGMFFSFPDLYAMLCVSVAWVHGQIMIWEEIGYGFRFCGFMSRLNLQEFVA